MIAERIAAGILHDIRHSPYAQIPDRTSATPDGCFLHWATGDVHMSVKVYPNGAIEYSRTVLLRNSNEEEIGRDVDQGIIEVGPDVADMLMAILYGPGAKEA